MSRYTPVWRRGLHRWMPFLFIVCDEANYHWKWQRYCRCGIGINGQFWAKGLAMRWIREWGWRRWLKHKLWWAIVHAVRKRCVYDWRHECVVCRKVAPGFHMHRDTLHEWRPKPKEAI